MNNVASVMDTVSLPVFALDADAYYVYENELARDLLGYDQVAITEKRITDLIVYDPVLLLTGFEGLRHKGYFSGGVRYRHRDGTYVDADVNTFRQTAHDGTVVFVSLVHPLAGIRASLPKVLETTAVHGLTAGEMRLLHLIADGFSDQQIARLLGDREDSVDQQMRALVKKMNASSRREAVVLAFKKHVLL